MQQESDIHTHVVFVTAFIQKGNQFLLAKRNKDDPQAGGVWTTPGGKVDHDVSYGVIENTIKKEIAEEVGLTITNEIAYLGSNGFIRASGHYVISLFFLAQWKSGIAKPLEGQEEIRWYSLDKLNRLQNTPKYFQRMIHLLSQHLAKTNDTKN